MYSKRGDETTMAQAAPGDQVDLRRYLPHVVVVTCAVAVLPLWLAFWLTNGNPIGSTLLSIVMALALGRLGAALWQRTDASEDLVFDDLFAWSFLRRLHAQRSVVESVRRLGLDLDNMNDETGLDNAERLKLLRALAADLERGDPYTHGHSQRVARHAYMIAKTMQLPRKQRDKIRLAGLLHDVGKLRVPREVLNKPGKLTPEEFKIVQDHPGAGADMVEILGDEELTRMVRYHHERMDGSGYPEALEGPKIPLGARIIAVADTFDAVTSRRPYRPASRHRVAIEILERDAAVNRLDPNVVRAFNLYYSGRRSIRWWFILTAGWRHGLEAALVGVPRIGLVGVANAAAVGGAAIVMAGGAMMHATPQISERAEPKERQRIVREAKEKDVKAPGLNVADDASDGVATAHSRARSTNGKQAAPSKTERRSKRRAAGHTAVATKAPDHAKAPSKPRGGGDSEPPAVASGDSSAGTTSAAKANTSTGPADTVVDKVKEVAPKALDNVKAGGGKS